MFDLFFFLKTLIMTLVVVLLLQIRVGDYTLEDHAHLFVKTSSLTYPLQVAADGASRAIRDVMKRVHQSLSSRFWGNKMADEQSASRAPKFDWQRSQRYLEEQAQRAGREAKAAMQERGAQVRVPQSASAVGSVKDEDSGEHHPAQE